MHSERLSVKGICQMESARRHYQIHVCNAGDHVLGDGEVMERWLERCWRDAGEMLGR
jgi:hypothetical protein